ncbi:MAG: PolC-type DNA polymerase III [Bacilli bacterium]|jgi:DNA polymerase-3 subunit alpha (Gram-positive type)|nr:PolC-type DNA polymerase III [Bacilli bacterium]
MDQQLSKFLNEIYFNVDMHEHFENSVITQTSYINYKQLLIIELLLDTALPLNVYLEFEKCLNKFIYNIKCVYSFKNSNYASNIIYDYYTYFYKNALDTNKDLIKLDYHDEELKVIYKNHSIMMSSSIYQSKIENRMSLCGFNLNYHYDIDKDIVLENKVEARMNENTFTTFISKEQQLKDKQNINNNNSKNKTVRFSTKKTNLDKYHITPIIELYEDKENVCIEGYIFDIDYISYTSKKDHKDRLIQVISITDFDDSITLKRFENKFLTKDMLNELEVGMWIKALGNVVFDDFSLEHTIMLNAIEIIDNNHFKMTDESVNKRIEFNVHTKMSTMDGVSSAKDYIKQALTYNHQALAITDTNNVQAYPEAYNELKNEKLKIIYGLSSNLINDTTPVVNVDDQRKLDDVSFVCFDLETSGLNSFDNEIIEIGAVKYKNNQEIARFQSFVKPDKEVSAYIKGLTGINSSDLINAPHISQILPDFLDFCNDAILVAHNANFDIGFIKQNIKKLNLKPLDNTVIDTILLARLLNKDKTYFSLKNVSSFYSIGYDDKVAHRADYDADVLGNVFLLMLDQLKEEHQCFNINDINKLCDLEYYIKLRPNNCSLIVKNQDGLKDLFKLVSIANTTYFYKEANLLKSEINKYRTNILVGSGNIQGELYQYARTLVEEDFLKLLDFYDYIEVLAPSNLKYLLDINDFSNYDEIISITKYIIDCAIKLNKIVIAIGDVHYCNKMDKQYWEVYINALGKGKKRHYLNDRQNRIKNYPDCYYKNTQEMLDEFDFLDYSLARKIVVENTQLLASKIENVIPIKSKLYTPKIEGSEQKLIDLCYENAYAQYGNPLPDIVKNRLEKELNSIIKHGYSVIYYISSLLVRKSISDGYVVGSRGSVGSSLVATLSNITEVNPLPPHYYCPKCHYVEFIEDDNYKSGYDLPYKKCPKCQSNLKGDGHNIPFETFLGFEGDKVPDIDLNFSGEYQSKAHNYIKEMFGEDYVYRAGTIQTIQNKTAYGYALGYYENKPLAHQVRKAEYARLAKGCEGTKSTTGQHPGGVIIIPDDMDVYDFTPVNYPADDTTSEWKTTHFDFHAIHDNVLKMDILGHVDPTAMRMLEDLTNIEPKDVPTNDAKVISIFNSNEALNLSEEVSYQNGAIGLPEFGTQFVRGMLDDTHPQSFADLVQISGLSHGTDVWLNNAQTLIKEKICQLNDVIGCRDDIMTYLINKGIEAKVAFSIMESVRKGKGLTDDFIKTMKENNVPDWYIDSCKKIKYMFPKAHAVAYVLMAVRVAWFKLYYPLEYYATFFTTRCKYYDILTLLQGLNATKKRLKEILDNKNASAKELELITTFEVAIEMFLRGYQFEAVDLYKSSSNRFVVNNDNNSLILPFNSIEGLGFNVANTVIKARENGEFLSIEDLENRTTLNKNHIDTLKNIGSLDGLSNFNQLSLF